LSARFWPRTAVVALGTLLTLSVPACRERRAPDAPLEVLVTSEPETLDPRVSTDPVSMRVTRLVHAGLTRLDPNTLLPIPYAAQSWTWRSPRVLEVTLRQDLQFASGAPFTAEDVAASIAAYQGPSSRHQRVVDSIGAVKAEGLHSVVIELKEDHATLLSDLELPILRQDEARGAIRSDLGAPLDGLGPYRIGPASMRGTLELLPRDHGALPKPKHALTIRTLRDENARALRLRGGESDVAVNAFSPTLLPSLDGVRARNGSNLTYMLVRDSARLPIAVRRALSLSIDRARLTRTLFAGFAVPATSVFPAEHWVHADLPELYPHAEADARSMLQASGYATDGSDARLRFTLHTSTDRLRQSVARWLAQECRRLGITLELMPLELGTMIARLSDGDFELAILQIPELTEPNALRTFLHSRSVPPVGSNRGRVHDDALDALLEQGAQAADLEARKRIYRSVEERISATLPIIPLWNEQWSAVTSPRARTFLPSAEGRWLGLAELP
jgi:peptide/nickel transport system substrate-binding protein